MMRTEIAATMLIGLGVILVFYGGFVAGANDVRCEAALKGHAIYAVDEYGTAQFEWLPPMDVRDAAQSALIGAEELR